MTPDLLVPLECTATRAIVAAALRSGVGVSDG